MSMGPIIRQYQSFSLTAADIFVLIEAVQMVGGLNVQIMGLLSD